MRGTLPEVSSSSCVSVAEVASPVPTTGFGAKPLNNPFKDAENELAGSAGHRIDSLLKDEYAYIAVRDSRSLDCYLNTCVEELHT